ncbi:MAG: hypothetical protein CMJ49_03035 [Planctomycetaceae bacterium]|nr:hypothetical protein [Planctomycetaceae bacterium]
MMAVDWIMAKVEISAAKVNRELLGEISPAQMRLQRIVGGVVLAAVMIGFVWMMIAVWRYFSAVAAPFTGTRQKRHFFWGYMLLAPALILVIWWQYFPLAAGLSISFMDFQLVRDSSWEGLDNFALVLFDKDFWASFGRTIYFVALAIGLGFWPPILLAILLQEVPTNTLKYFYRTVFYLPQVIAGVIVIFLWLQLYDSSPNGVLNQLLLSLNDLGPLAASLVKIVSLVCWTSLIALLIYLPIKIDEMGIGLKLALWAAAAVFLAVTVWQFVIVAMPEGVVESDKRWTMTILGLKGAGIAICIAAGIVMTMLARQFWKQSPRARNFFAAAAVIAFAVGLMIMHLTHRPLAGAVYVGIAAALWGGGIVYLLWATVRASSWPMYARALSFLLSVALIVLAAGALTADHASTSGSAGWLALLGIVPFELKALKWIDSPGMAMLCVVIPTIWAGAGPGCILYLAALKTVPDELYEAADIDGASNWHKVFYIVLPRLKYLIMIQFIAAVIGAFKGGTEYVLVLTGGGPQNATQLLSLEIFIRTFMDLKYGIGTAMAWLLGGVLIVFTVYQLRMLSRAEFRAAGSD